jgi:hypothetical protein
VQRTKIKPRLKESTVESMAALAKLCVDDWDVRDRTIARHEEIRKIHGLSKKKNAHAM